MLLMLIRYSLRRVRTKFLVTDSKIAIAAAVPVVVITIFNSCNDTL
jgi:hypothetical protein